MTVLVTRPKRDSLAFAAILRRRGIESLIAPLLMIVDVTITVGDLDGVQGCVVTSANGADALARATANRSVPVLAVGTVSAARAREHGFTGVHAAGGDLESLAVLIRRSLDPGVGRLIHVSGSRIAGDLAGLLARDGFVVERVVGYHAEAASGLPQVALAALRGGHLLGVAHFSPRTAAIFMRLVREAGVETSLQSLVGFCLSDAVARTLEGSGWKDLVVAPRSDAESLAGCIALAGEHS